MVTEQEVLDYSGDVKFMERLEKLIPYLQRVRPVRTVIQAIASRSGVFNSEYVMLEGLYVLQKRSNLTKSQRETILNIIEFSIEEYKKWLEGNEEENN